MSEDEDFEVLVSTRDYKRQSQQMQIQEQQLKIQKKENDRLNLQVLGLSQKCNKYAKEIQKKDKDIVTLSKQIFTLSQKLLDYDQQNIQLKIYSASSQKQTAVKCLEVLDDKQKCNQIIEKSIRQAKEFNEQMSSLKNSILQYEKLLKSAKQKNQVNEVKIDDLNTKLQNSKQQKIVLAGLIDEKYSTIQKYLSNIKQNENTISQKNSAIQNLQEQALTLKQKITQKNNAIQALQKELEILNEVLARKVTEKDDLIQAIQKETQILKKQNYSLKEQIAQRSQRLQNHQKRVIQLQLKIQQNQTKMQSLKDGLLNLQKQNEFEILENKKQKDQLEQALNSIKNMTKQHEKAISDMQNSKRISQENFTRQLQQKNQQIEKLEQKLQNQQRQIEKVKRQLLLKVQSSVNTIQEYEQTLRKMKQQLENLQFSRKQLQKAINSINNEMNILKDENENLKSRMYEKDKENLALQEKISSIQKVKQAQVMQSQCQIARLKQENQKEKRDVMRLAGQLKKQKDKNEFLQDQIIEAKQDRAIKTTASNNQLQQYVLQLEKRTNFQENLIKQMKYDINSKYILQQQYNKIINELTKKYQECKKKNRDIQQSKSRQKLQISSLNQTLLPALENYFESITAKLLQSGGFQPDEIKMILQDQKRLTQKVVQSAFRNIVINKKNETKQKNIEKSYRNAFNPNSGFDHV